MYVRWFINKNTQDGTPVRSHNKPDQSLLLPTIMGNNKSFVKPILEYGIIFTLFGAILQACIHSIPNL